MPTVITQGAASAKGYGFGARTTAANYIEDVFSTYLYTGTASAQTITNGIDLSGKGGMVWLKSRSGADSHYIVDTARGSNKVIYSNLTNAEETLTRFSSFNSNGFSLSTTPSNPNVNGYTYASWTFRKQAKFFDVVTYTGNGNNGTAVISHSLGSVPGCIIIKKTSTSSDWYTYHRSFNGGTNAYQYGLFLNTTAAVDGPTSTYHYAAPTSTNFYPNSLCNSSGATYVAYLFAHDAGGFGAAGTDNVISCGSFTTDGSGNATVSLGYEPQMLIAKRSDSTGNWILLDTMRGWINLSTGFDNPLFANSSQAESTGTFNYGNPTATGFDFSGGPASGTMIYIAIRRGPMKTPTSGTSVFALQAYSDGVGGAALAGSTQSFVNLRPDLSVFANRAGSTNNFQFADLLRGYQQTTGPGADTLTTPTLKTTNSNAEATSGNAIYVLPANGSNPPEVRFSSDSVGAKLGYIFRRAPGFFDVVCYTGTGANTTQTHNLGAIPELMIVKQRNSARSWGVYSAALAANEVLILNDVNAKDIQATYFNSTRPTASVFSVGTNPVTNGSANTYVAYLFATVAGVSKVGSYTGTAALQTINCGFTGGARFVLIKRTDDLGAWYVWDSTRGISSGNDPYLLLNSIAAEVTGTNYVDTTSVGFQVTAAAPVALNASGGTYIFLAIA